MNKRIQFSLCIAAAVVIILVACHIYLLSLASQKPALLSEQEGFPAFQAVIIKNPGSSIPQVDGEMIRISYDGSNVQESVLATGSPQMELRGATFIDGSAVFVTTESSESTFTVRKEEDGESIVIGKYPQSHLSNFYMDADIIFPVAEGIGISAPSQDSGVYGFYWINLSDAYLLDVVRLEQQKITGLRHDNYALRGEQESLLIIGQDSMLDEGEWVSAMSIERCHLDAMACERIAQFQYDMEGNLQENLIRWSSIVNESAIVRLRDHKILGGCVVPALMFGGCSVEYSFSFMDIYLLSGGERTRIYRMYEFVRGDEGYKLPQRFFLSQDNRLLAFTVHEFPVNEDPISSVYIIDMETGESRRIDNAWALAIDH